MKVIFQGNGIQEFDHYVVCNTCFSMIQCQKYEIKMKQDMSQIKVANGYVDVFIGPPYSTIDCPICEIETTIEGNFMVPHGLPETIVVKRSGYGEYLENKTHKRQKIFN